MIPVNEPSLGRKELELARDCIESGWISSEGKYIQEFEEKWASYCGRKYGIAVANGTVALETALWSLRLEPGSEIIMPSFTIISCVLAVLRNGLVPVLVDSSPETWCMDVKQVEQEITPRTRTIMPVHIYGHPVDMDPLLEIAEKHRLYILEDAAEAHGAEYKGRRCGSFGTLSSFSFYANKLVTTGEGGMVVTNDAEAAERCRSYRNLCFRKEKRFYHTELGTNYRLTNLQAAVGVAQVDRITEIVRKKRWMGALYTDLLKDVRGIKLQAIKPWAKSVYWMYGILLTPDVTLDADTLAAKLVEKGIQTRPFFLGMHRQPVLNNMGFFREGRYPVADHIALYGLYLPSGLAITDDQIRFAVRSLREILESHLI